MAGVYRVYKKEMYLPISEIALEGSVRDFSKNTSAGGQHFSPLLPAYVARYLWEQAWTLSILLALRTPLLCFLQDSHHPIHSCQSGSCPEERWGKITTHTNAPIVPAAKTQAGHTDRVPWWLVWLQPQKKDWRSHLIWLPTSSTKESLSGENTGRVPCRLVQLQLQKVD